MLDQESEDEKVKDATPVKKVTKKGKGDACAIVASKRASAGLRI
jgi:hypothetical protein